MEAAGPVWTYWAFPTERFCDRLYLTQPRARQYPYFRRKSCNTKLSVYGLNLFLLPCYSVDLEPYLHRQHLCFYHLICLCHIVHIIAHAPSVSPESSLQGRLVLLTNLLGWKRLEVGLSLRLVHWNKLHHHPTLLPHSHARRSRDTDGDRFGSTRVLGGEGAKWGVYSHYWSDRRVAGRSVCTRRLSSRFTNSVPAFWCKLRVVHRPRIYRFY